MRSIRKYKPVAQKWNLRPRVPVNKIYWEFHKGDADFNPSVPHGHSLNGKSLDGKYKLELWSGKIHVQSTGELIGIAKPKDMLRLYQSEGFQTFVEECRAEYAKDHPHMQLPPLSPNPYITGMNRNKLRRIGMFVPLGILLPWIHKLFRKWYIILGCGFAFSLVIEIFQGITRTGLFDVDDLFSNTLGTIFGYGLYMALRSLFIKAERNAVRISSYAAIPLVIALTISSIFVVYVVKDYGNLQDAAIYRVSTKGVEWVFDCELSEQPQTVSIYKAKTYNKEACDEFGKAFLDGRTTRELDICYYDQETYYLDHSEHSLFVSHLDCSYEYKYDPNEGERIPAEADKETIERLLAEFDIVIPETAVFTYEGEGWHRIDVPMGSKEEGTVGGTLRCRYSSEGFIYVIHNNLVSFTYCADEQIISEAQAFEQLKHGNFYGGVFEMLSPKNVTILSCELKYQVDTKGYYQPVYMFKVMYDGVEDEMRIMIPALD